MPADKLADLRQGRLQASPHYLRVDLPFYKEHLESFLPGKIIDPFVLAIEPHLLRDPPLPERRDDEGSHPPTGFSTKAGWKVPLSAMGTNLADCLGSFKETKTRELKLIRLYVCW
jgi:hypothetical protein